MAANLAAVRTLVRRDLHDEDAAAYRWTDTVLDRHIGRAVNQYSLHSPQERRTAFNTVAGSRDLNVTTLIDTGHIEFDRVEWPTGEFPPRFVGFSVQRISTTVVTLTMDVVSPPNGVENAYVYDVKNHTLDGSGSTIPAVHDDIICAGAAAYAALDWTSFSTNRINTGGADVYDRYAQFGDERLRYFQEEIRRIGRRNKVRTRRLYSTDAPSIFEQQRVKY